MNRFALMILASLLIAADDPKGDLDKIQGTWVLVSREYEGEKTQDPQEVGFKVTFEDKKVIVQQEGMTIPFGAFELDSSRKPKTYDRIIEDCRNPSEPLKGLGIYELDGDTLRICLSNPGGERPTEFVTKPGDGRSLLIYKRERPHQPSGHPDR